MNLASVGAYKDLDMTIEQALSYRSEVREILLHPRFLDVETYS
jgi:hypothetical protein